MCLLKNENPLESRTFASLLLRLFLPVTARYLLLCSMRAWRKFLDIIKKDYKYLLRIGNFLLE